LSNPSSNPIIASFLPTFLKPEMWHVYRQLTGLESFCPVILAHKRENAGHFPFPEERIHLLRRPWTREIQRFWTRRIRHRPLRIQRGEAERFHRKLRELNADLLHIYFGHNGIYLLPLYDLWDKPIIVSFHGADVEVDLRDAHSQALMREMLERSTLILARSEALRRNLIAIGAPEDKVRLNRTAVPLDEFDYRQKSPPADGVWQFLQASRLISKKGLDLTLEAFARITERYPKAQLVIAGEGPLLEPLKQKTMALRIADCVRFTGFLEQDALREIMHRSHIFIHPSRQTGSGDREGIPNAMLEAMACGLPVVSTHHGGIPEAVTHEKSGLLVEEDDIQALTAALERITTQQGLMEQLSAGAREEVVTKFSPQSQTRQLEETYALALSSA
jgi:colanic acid/amylovoran biosynthesis glycosyltransferase